MIITDIIKDKKHLNRVLFDNGSEELLDLELFCERPLHKGDSISSEDLEALKYRSDYIRAKSKALWYLDRCSYSEKALKDKLKQSGFSEKVSAQVIKRLKELSLVDDTSLAKRLAEYFAQNNTSKREIYAKLMQRGIPKEIIVSVLEDTVIDEESQIKALIQKKYKNKLGERAENEKIYAALCRKGFSFSAVRNVLKEYVEQLQYADGEDY